MPQGIDDFTIILPELTDMAACELKVYDGSLMVKKLVAARILLNKADSSF
jgi:hypothetical protein